MFCLTISVVCILILSLNQIIYLLHLWSKFSFVCLLSFTFCLNRLTGFSFLSDADMPNSGYWRCKMCQMCVFPYSFIWQNSCETQRRWESHRSRCPTRSRDQADLIKRLDKCSFTVLWWQIFCFLLAQDILKSSSFY